VRAGVQAFSRTLDEDRWTVGQFLLDRGVFGGTREPQHHEQPLTALAAQADATLRFVAAGADHKLLASLAHSHVGYERLQRGLDTEGRNALPADVRTFNPYSPNYYRPAYDPGLFRRVITDRTETTGYTTFALSERAAFAHGRFVATLGMRADFVDFELDDRRPGATFPTVSDRVSQTTWHAGANVLVAPSRLLLFGNASTAFQPSTRVDARTGQLQGNDTTRGVELGAKGLFLDRRLNITALVYAFANENISRRNPLYNDPILDANLTQPELVAAGEEEFTGGTLDFRSQVTRGWTVSGRASYARALTTRSPDLPEEEGRQLSRIPSFSFSFQNRYAFNEGRLRGLSMGLGVVHVSDYVQSYESSSREFLAYPSYTLASFNAGYRWTAGRRTHALGLSCANLLDRDLLASHARVDAGRQLGMNYSLSY
jgi:iron complex outermembrane receptor protein